jgi:vacuolar-type H+-ATPase subunit I/STV1
MSIFGGIILIVSEILPFIKCVKSNGLLELFINMSKYFLKNNNNNNGLENEPLMNDIENSIRNQIGIRHDAIDNLPVSNPLSNQLDSLNVNINNISYTLNNYINEAHNSRQLKLQSIELYELNYIINYIKVNYPKKMFQTRFLSKTNKQLLISQGYIVDYDSQNDTHTIKW